MPPVRIILPTCLFLSGFCALAYQVAWVRYLAMFLGATAPAYTIVLATFMGGLAGGAWLFGRRADRTDRPLRMYARLELLVALICFAFPWLIDAVGSLYLMMAAPLVDQPLPRNVLRLGIAVLVLTVPTLLMGGTLPAATRFYVRAIDKVGEGVGRLYFVNALGAVGGALLAGFLLIPSIGLHGTVWLAALLNAAIGYWALRTSKRIDGASACPAPGWESALEDLEKPGPRESRFPAWVAILALSAAAASGAASMIYEVSWIRLLVLVLGGSTYAFTVMVAAFILGIAIGAALVSWWKPLSRGGLRAFGWLEVLVAFVVLAMVPIYNRLSYYYLEIAAGIPREDGNYGIYLLVGFLLCLGVMLVPTVLLGAIFPLAARLSTRSIDTLGGGVGRAYAFDTGGTILGALVAGHLLFPWLGLYGAFAVAAGLNLVAGVACLASASWMGTPRESEQREDKKVSSWGRLAHSLLLAGMLGLFGLITALGPRLDNEVLSRGMFRSKASGFDDYGQFKSWLTGGMDLLFYQDGPEGSVSVLEVAGQRVLNVNGKPEASSEGDMPTQLCVAHLPMMLHPEPKRALLIGLGGGATAGALLTHTEVKTTVVELSPQVVAANRHFAEFNRGVMENPSLDLVVEDAKAYLGLTREWFDIIVSQPSNPWVSGNANLFTVEFFRLMKSRLSPGGLMVQWFHDYEMTDDAVGTILHTFAAAFPHVRLFHCGDGRDYVLIGASEPIDPDPAVIEERLASNEEAAADMKHHLGVRSSLGILTRNILDDAGVREAAKEGRLHRDHRPILDFQAPRGVFLGSMSHLIIDADQRWDPAEKNDLLIWRITDDGNLGADERFKEAVDGTMPPFCRLRRSILNRWLDVTDSAEARRRLATELIWVGLDDEALELLRELHEMGESEIEDELERWSLEALVAYQEGRDREMGSALTKMSILAHDVDGPRGYDALADMAEMLGENAVAADAWRMALSRTEEEGFWERIERLVGLARASRRAGLWDEAFEALDMARSLRPDHWPLVAEIETFESTGGADYLAAWQE